MDKITYVKSWRVGVLPLMVLLTGIVIIMSQRPVEVQTYQFKEVVETRQIKHQEALHKQKKNVTPEQKQQDASTSERMIARVDCWKKVGDFEYKCLKGVRRCLGKWNEGVPPAPHGCR
jgi:hypothetical protein